MLPTFQNPDLLTEALTHRSALNENNSTSSVSNERLEYLGDAVLELITSEYLFNQFPKEPEGILTAYRSALVKTTTLAKVATTLRLGDQLLMSKGEEATGGRTNTSLLANTFEALLGALYLDQGHTTVKAFLELHLFPEITTILKEKLYKDSKSHLQEVVQSKGYETPTYEVLNETGPDHDKEFTVVVKVEGTVKGTGKGPSKQKAQQAAASAALTEYDA